MNLIEWLRGYRARRRWQYDDEAGFQKHMKTLWRSTWRRTQWTADELQAGLDEVGKEPVPERPRCPTCNASLHAPGSTCMACRRSSGVEIPATMKQRGRICPGCQSSTLAPRRRICDEGREVRRREDASWRKTSAAFERDTCCWKASDFSPLIPRVYKSDFGVTTLGS